MVRAVILDRDGTINEDADPQDRIFQKEDLKFIPGAVTAIRLLNEAGFKVIVATNQAAVGKGLCTERDVRSFHAHMNRLLKARSAHVSRFYFCPHHPEATRPKYRRVCHCRKPEPGMLKQAIRDFQIDVGHSFMIGDSTKDVEAGRRAGLMTIRLTASGDRSGGDYTAPNLLAAAKLILSKIRPGAAIRS
jgi:D-glycero-D-manno-heptose 1,7-bisphosphate phosphatase